MARLFAAAVPPPDVRSALRALAGPRAPGVRWVPEWQLHVTLRFLGGVDVTEARTALASLVAPPAVAEVGPAVGLLGDRVVHLPVSGLDALASAVDAALRDVAEPADHPFRGHLTLGRRRRPDAPVPLVGTRWSGRFAVERVVLVRSRLGPGPPDHEVVGERRLG